MTTEKARKQEGRRAKNLLWLRSGAQEKKEDQYGLCDCYLVYIPYTLDRSTGPRLQKRLELKNKNDTHQPVMVKQKKKSKKISDLFLNPKLRSLDFTIP